MQSGNTAIEIYNSILHEIKVGYTKFLGWGANDTCLLVLKNLQRDGFLKYICGIVDTKGSGKTILGIPIYSPENVHQLEFDVLVIMEDASKESALLEYSKMDKRIPKVILAGNEHFRYSDRKFDEILKSCTVSPKAGGYPSMLIHIYQSLVYLAELVNLSFQ